MGLRVCGNELRFGCGCECASWYVRLGECFDHKSGILHSDNYSIERRVPNYGGFDDVI